MTTEVCVEGPSDAARSAVRPAGVVETHIDSPASTSGGHLCVFARRLPSRHADTSNSNNQSVMPHPCLLRCSVGREPPAAGRRPGQQPGALSAAQQHAPAAQQHQVAGSRQGRQTGREDLETCADSRPSLPAGILETESPFIRQTKAPSTPLQVHQSCLQKASTPPCCQALWS